MSANPTRVDWKAAPAADSSSPLQQGNVVLESITNREALAALRAFSDFHTQVRNRRGAMESASYRDLCETERFILDEVLQLICDRALAITQADSIVLALAEGPAMICRAAAGTLAIARGVEVISESEFLQSSLASGSVLTCDDCSVDTRVEVDFARQIEAGSTVMVPLRGRREQLGVLQAFSTTAHAFTNNDIRSLELFAELLLSSLRPKDEDRRINWLADVASDVLKGKPDAAAAVVEAAANVGPDESSGLGRENFIETGNAPYPLPASEELLPADLLTSGLELLTELVVISADLVELPDLVGLSGSSMVYEELDDQPFEIEATLEPATPKSDELPISSPLPRGFSLPGSSRPGLSVVMALLAVAALFSAGAWWGMQMHAKSAIASARPGQATMPVATATKPVSPRPVTTPAAPVEMDLSLGASDNLMNPGKLDSDGVPLDAVADSKLAALPKITGVRHWSSATGSTVVIDMDDQVPYEVHRLMSPERIYFDLHDTVLSHELEGKTMDVGDASLSRVRIAQPVAGVTRVVLDTQGGSNFSVSMESSPYRLVVELHGNSKTSDKTLAANSIAPAHTLLNHSLAAPTTASTTVSTNMNVAPVSAKPAPMATLATKASDQPLPAKTGKFRIVLDAGHGGWDLGTVGRQGLLEKDLVLDVTQRLGKLLRARLGSEVMFTRSSDTYLPLEQRADFANQTQADLFISVHANYSTSAAARGVETYYTNLFSAPGSKEVEKHDDGNVPKPAPATLSAAGLHEKIEESRRLAASVQHSLYGTLAANNPDIRNRGIKDSAFAVLTGTTMPAILTEISFVSSPADEHSLQSAAYRQQIAEALYKGIAHYQETSPRVKVAQLQTTAARS